MEALHNDGRHTTMVFAKNGLKVLRMQVSKDLSGAGVDVGDVLAEDTILCYKLGDVGGGMHRGLTMLVERLHDGPDTGSKAVIVL